MRCVSPRRTASARASLTTFIRLDTERALACVRGPTCTQKVSLTPSRTQFIIALAHCNRGARAFVPVAQQKSSCLEQFQHIASGAPQGPPPRRIRARRPTHHVAVRNWNETSERQRRAPHSTVWCGPRGGRRQSGRRRDDRRACRRDDRRDCRRDDRRDCRPRRDDRRDCPPYDHERRGGDGGARSGQQLRGVASWSRALRRSIVPLTQNCARGKTRSRRRA